jgi:large subunit ribosomal protein L28
MSKQCAICEKKTIIGRQISHAHNVSARSWQPNLQRVRALVDGSVQRILVCTRCLRTGKVVKPPVREFAPESTESAETAESSETPQVYGGDYLNQLSDLQPLP